MAKIGILSERGMSEERGWGCVKEVMQWVAGILRVGAHSAECIV